VTVNFSAPLGAAFLEKAAQKSRAGENLGNFYAALGIIYNSPKRLKQINYPTSLAHKNFTKFSRLAVKYRIINLE